MRLLLTVISIFLYVFASAQFKGIIVNEFSQGDQGSREYIELLVVGKRTCNDSTADIRGWIVDDQNGWYGTTNISDGHYRFKDVPQWAAVPFGSIILLYNAASGQKNLSIILADDSTDANHDYTYVLPINTKTLVEEHDNQPDNMAPSTAFVYPAATITAGYAGASNLWVQHIALNNTGGDVISVISRNKRDSAFFSIGYGYPITAGFRSPTVAINNVGTAQGAGLTDSNYTLTTRWNIAPVPAFETPGAPNGGANSTWIAAMRTTPVALHTYTTACSNNSYIFFGQTITATGPYTVLYTNNNACVDTNDLYVVIRKTDIKDTTACDSLIYRGIKYTINTTITDHISSVVINCDSIVRTLNIKINKSSSSFTKTCIGVGQTYTFNGNTYNTSGSYTATLVNSKGCDSIARLYLTAAVLQTSSVSGCGSVVYKGITYTTSTTIYDTAKSLVTGCDSLINKTLVQVNPIKTTSITQCANNGDIYNFNGQPITASGTYTATLTTTLGCDSIVKLYIVFKKILVQNFSGCDSVSVNNIKYYQSVLLADTIKSLVTNCDSLVSLKNIIVNRSKTSYQTACALSSYSFFGQTLAVGGNYSHTLSTASGCDSIIKLYLVITQTQTQTLAGCDSIIFRNQTYYTAASISDTIRSTVTNCDSLIYHTQIIINPVKHNYISACIAGGQTYTFNGQVLSQSGQYLAVYNTGTCDSVVHLRLVITQQQTINLSGCDSVTYNGTAYTASALLQTAIPSTITGCDSILKTVAITISSPVHRNLSVCLPEGGSYLFNGQPLISSGSYTAQYSTATCDSFVHLRLTVAQSQSQTYTGCDSVFYNGQFYYTNLQLTDTAKSLITGCDSLYRITRLVVSKRAETYTFLCLKQGEVSNFNGQVLTSSGNYVTNFSRPGLCDSIVHLRLVVSVVQARMLSGCDTVVYNNFVYHTSTILSDTIKSSSSNCDSIIHIVNIQVNKKPVLQVSEDVSICKGDTTTLTASSPNNTVSWSNFGNGNSIIVAPLSTTIYQATVMDAVGCSNSSAVTVTVQDFLLTLNASPNPVLSGAKTILQTNATLPYSVLKWQPLSNFTNQTSKVQQVVADSSMMISVYGVSSAGCIDTAFLQLDVIPLDDIYIPSGFTPNGDGKNDRLSVIGSYVKELDFKVYNRWGQLVFHTTGKLGSWDGTVGGRLQASDTYVFVVRAIKTNGKVVEKKGTVVLIR